MGKSKNKIGWIIAGVVLLVVVVLVGAILVFAGNKPAITKIDGKDVNLFGQVSGAVSATPVIAGTARANSVVYVYNQPAPVVKTFSSINNSEITAPVFQPGNSNPLEPFTETFGDDYYRYGGWGTTNGGGRAENGVFQITGFNNGISREIDLSLNSQQDFSIEGEFTAPQSYDQLTIDFGIQNNWGPPHKSLKLIWAYSSSYNGGPIQKGIMIVQNSDMAMGLIEYDYGNGAAKILAKDESYPKLVPGTTYKLKLVYDGNTTATAYVNGSQVVQATNVAPLTDYNSNINGGNIRKEVMLGIRAAGYGLVNPVLNVDNVVTSFQVRGEPKPAGFMLPKTGFAFEGVNYNDPAPMFGDGVEGIVSFASKGPIPLPGVISEDDFKYLGGGMNKDVFAKDIYAYLCKINIPAGAVGNETELAVNWTVYDIKNPYQFASMVMGQLSSQGISMSVDAYAKIYTASATENSYTATSNPITSLGTIDSAGNVLSNDPLPILIARAKSDANGVWSAQYGKDENGSIVLAGTLSDLGAAPYKIFAETEVGSVTKIADGADIAIPLIPGGEVAVSDSFDGDRINWDLWDGNPDALTQSDGKLHVSKGAGFQSRDIVNGDSFSMEADVTPTWVDTAGCTSGLNFGVTSSYWNGSPKNVRISWFDEGSPSNCNHFIQITQNDGGPSFNNRVEYPAPEVGKNYKIKLTYDAPTNRISIFVNDMVNPVVSGITPEPVNYDKRISIGLWNGLAMDFDNFSSTLTMKTEDAFQLSAPAMSYDGVVYNDPAPMFGDPNTRGVMLWVPEDEPRILPVSIPGEYFGKFGDIYAYLTHLDVPAGLVGPEPAVFNWTIYSSNPQVFSSVLAQFKGMGIAVDVAAFVKVTTIDYENKTIDPIQPPLQSQGLITGDGQMLNRDRSSMVFINEIAAPVVDADGDGVKDDVDACINVKGKAEYDGCPYAIVINSELLVNYIGKTKFTKKLPVKVGSLGDPMDESITSVEAKVFKLADLGKPYGEIQKNCGTYYDSVTAKSLNTKSIPLGTELLGVPSKDGYVVMQRVAVYEPAANTTGIMTTCRNVELKDFASDVVKKEMPIIKSVKDGKVTLSGGQTTVMTGSTLEIVYPENIVWEEGIKNYIYTYIFTSDSDWNVDICTYTPEGYKVAGVYDDNGNLTPSGGCTQAFVANETKVVAFEVTDVGSPKEFDVGLKITGKRVGQNKEQKIDTKMHTKITPKDKIAKKGKVILGDENKNKNTEKKSSKKTSVSASLSFSDKLKNMMDRLF